MYGVCFSISDCMPGTEVILYFIQKISDVCLLTYPHNEAILFLRLSNFDNLFYAVRKTTVIV